MNIKQLKRKLKLPPLSKMQLDFQFGQMTIEFRVKHGLSPKKFCKLIGISEKTLNKIESN